MIPEIAAALSLIVFYLACYASVAGRMEEAKGRLRHAINLDKDIRRLALDDKDLRPMGGLDRWGYFLISVKEEKTRNGI